MVSSLLCLPLNAGRLYYNDGHKLSRAITREGLVVLKNENNTIRWNIDLTDRFGVENYPFGSDATLSLQCAGRENTEEEPQVEIRSDKPVTVEIFWDGGK